MTRADSTVRFVLTPESPVRLRARLSPPYPPGQAARIADAAVSDTMLAVSAMPVGDGPTLFVRAGTPQVSPLLLADAAALLGRFDAVIGPTTGGGWWAFGLRESMRSFVPDAAMSTGALTLAMLRLGLLVAMLPMLKDVSTAADVPAVAGDCLPTSRFARVVAGW